MTISINSDNIPNNSGIPPIIKWAGGKRWLVRDLIERVECINSKLIEPFCGGAALFFALAPSKAILADTNSDLIITYRCIRDNVEKVLAIMSRYSNNIECYYEVRACNPTNEYEIAARFLYLCRLSFNSLYRVNKHGHFNVPYNNKSHLSVSDPNQLRMASQLLCNASLENIDFEVAISNSSIGDVVYADPPYTVAHNNNGFNKYNKQIFTYFDQQRLAYVAKEAVKRGVIVLISNADHESIRSLYSGSIITTYNRHSIMSSKSEFRKPITEILIEVKL